MRIAIDARELTGHATGVGRYLMQLLLAWNEMPAAAAHEFILCTSSVLAPQALANLKITYRQRPRFEGTLWEQATLPLLVNDAQVLFAPAYTAPLFCRVPTVLTIHDVSFAAHPEWFGWKEGLRRRLLTRASARQSARILTVSDFSKREIVKRLGVYRDKVDVIYSGVHQLTARSRWRVRPDEPPDISQRPLILYVGSILNRRHVPELIAGFTLLARTHPEVRLAIVGDNRTRPRIDLTALASQTGLAERIEVHDYIADGQLAGLYERASAFAFLSDYEGFGFTPLEALSADVPPVVLETEVAREIYGRSAVYVKRPEPHAICAALECALYDPAERARILDISQHVLRRYSWRECAHRTLQVLLACAS